MTRRHLKQRPMSHHAYVYLLFILNFNIKFPWLMQQSDCITPTDYMYFYCLRITNWQRTQSSKIKGQIHTCMYNCSTIDQWFPRMFWPLESSKPACILTQFSRWMTETMHLQFRIKFSKASSYSLRASSVWTFELAPV